MNLDNPNVSLSDEISLKVLINKVIEWKQLLISKWRILLLISIVGGCVGIVYAWSKKTMYTAVTTFVLEDGSSSPNMGGLGGVASIVGIDIGGGGGGIFQGDNIIELYRSRKMIEKTLLTSYEQDGKKQLLIDLYIDFNDLREKWKKSSNLNKLNFITNPGLEYPNSTRLKDSIIGTIVNDISSNYLSVGKPDKKLNIIRVDLVSPNEFFADKFNTEIVKNVNDFYVQTKTKKSLDNVMILQHKTDSVREVMNGAIFKAANIIDATPNLNPTRQTQRTGPVQSSQFSAETNRTVLSEMVKNLEMSKIALIKETPLIQVIDAPVFPLQKDVPSKLKYMFLGALFSLCLTCVFLLVKKIINDILI